MVEPEWGVVDLFNMGGMAATWYHMTTCESYVKLDILYMKRIANFVDRYFFLFDKSGKKPCLQTTSKSDFLLQ